jgi:hypothetical protein
MTNSLLLPEETATAAGHGRCPLRCPDCRATPTFAPTPTQALPGGWFGVLRCDCHTDPVLDSPRLLHRWVVLGVPPRYARPPGAPGAIGSVARGLLRGAVRRLRDRRCSDRVQ